MLLYYPNLGSKEQCREVPLTFPAQHQDSQPGLEYLMDPLPIYEDPEYQGSGKLKGRVALITGGDSGIGRAVAIAYAKEGADLVIAYYDEHEDAALTRERVEFHGAKCLLISGDIQQEEHCQALVRQTIEQFGRLDILVNNAGVQFVRESLAQIPAGQLELTYRVNVFAMFHLTKAALPHLPEGGCIINTTSVTAYAGNERLIDYSSTKGAIVSFTRAMARSLVGRGIRVNGVAPGPIWTPLQPASYPAEDLTTFGAETPMQRAGQPVELAPTYVYLAGRDSSYVTGQILHVDGGMSMQS